MGFSMKWTIQLFGFPPFLETFAGRKEITIHNHISIKWGEIKSTIIYPWNLGKSHPLHISMKKTTDEKHHPLIFFVFRLQQLRRRRREDVVRGPFWDFHVPTRAATGGPKKTASTVAKIGMFGVKLERYGKVRSLLLDHWSWGIEFAIIGASLFVDKPISNCVGQIPMHSSHACFRIKRGII